MILFFKLLLAHLLGDFVLQPDSWVEDKELKKYKSPMLYIHGLLHFLLIMVFVRDPGFVLPAIIIAVSHVLIDAAKLQFQDQGDRRTWFFADQMLHVGVLVIVTLAVINPPVDLWTMFTDRVLLIVTGLVIMTTPSSIVIRLILSKWTPATEFKTDRIETSSLLHAGMMIGYLERLLVFIFILNSQWAAIGFLITAKSVFRFSDLKIGQDRKLTEYILIGTLLSFGIAIVAGVIINMLLATVGTNNLISVPVEQLLPGN